ncbi:MAG: toxin-antitoxin system HicB family antitoxin [Cyanobacteria bacterium P01_F01_bin.143]
MYAKHKCREKSQDCHALGKELNKPFPGKFNLRIPPDLPMKAATQAALNGMSLSSFVEHAIKNGI